MLAGICNYFPFFLISSISRLTPLQCTSARQCWPPGSPFPYSGNLVDCFKGACLCYPCFKINTTSGVCRVQDCYTYDDLNGCMDKRKSQKDAFLLSFFLSSLGAANFYIGHWELGIAQIVIFTMFLLCTCICCCFLCCLTCCEDCCCECNSEVNLQAISTHSNIHYYFFFLFSCSLRHCAV